MYNNLSIAVPLCVCPSYVRPIDSPRASSNNNEAFCVLSCVTGSLLQALFDRKMVNKSTSVRIRWPSQQAGLRIPFTLSCHYTALHLRGTHKQPTRGPTHSLAAVAQCIQLGPFRATQRPLPCLQMANNGGRHAWPRGRGERRGGWREKPLSHRTGGRA